MKTYDTYAGTLDRCFACGVKKCTQVLRWERMGITPGNAFDEWVYYGTEEGIYAQAFCDSCLDSQLKALDNLKHARLLEVIDLAIGSEEGEWV